MNSLQWLSRRNLLTTSLYEHPYDLVLYLERAETYSQLGYHDLVAGDAYRALLLTDEVQDETAEYHEQAGEALASHLQHQEYFTNGDDGIGCSCRGLRSTSNGAVENLNAGENSPEESQLVEENGDRLSLISALAKKKARGCYAILGRSLSHCGCLKSALGFTRRGLAAFPEAAEFQDTRQMILHEAKRRLSKEELVLEGLDLEALPDLGRARREVYPWNDHEPDRFSDETLTFLDDEMAKLASKCEVKATELPVLVDGTVSDSKVVNEAATIKQLGVFAKVDIEPGETFFKEKTVLVANNRLHESLCDACSSAFPDITSPRQPVDFEAASRVVSCPDCDDIFFCSEDCHELAQETYHPAVCGQEVETIGKSVPLKETSDGLYLLLLFRLIAMAETASINPLDLKEVKYIWGEFTPSEHEAAPTLTNETLPFSFTYNIATPLHFLEKLDLDIFALLPRYDLWILNTVYAKFRGTASARVSLRDGKPEVCAVHPIWCLANHSCDPNVAWEWGGEMKYWARDRRIPRPGDGPKGHRGGIAKGEEVLNHYCDIDLPVKERREWAVGSLGGWCMCERCVREENEE